MKQIPDLDWFNSNGVCTILEVSRATLDRMIAERRFPPPDGKKGKQRLWSFALVGDFCTEELTRQSTGIYRLLDGIERTSEIRKNREKGRKLALAHEAELSERQRLGIEISRFEHHLAGLVDGLHPSRKIAKLKRLFPLIYPDEHTDEPSGDPQIAAERKHWIALWREQRKNKRK